MRTFVRIVSHAAGVALLVASVAAQGGTPPPFQAWVNPQTGSNATGAVNDQHRPYLTIQAAINAVSGSIGATQQGVVYAMPGLYSDVAGANGETFPIVMQDRVHLQGLGAKECVVRLTGASALTLPSFVPAVNPLLRNGTIRPIFDMRNLQSVFVTSIEGITMQGGDVQVWTYSEIAQTVRVSNCVFDLRQGGEDSLIGPQFGMLLIPIWDFTSGGVYNPLNYHILNNTFIQGYRRSSTAGDTETSLVSNVAICNVNDPNGPSPDPNPTLRGVSNLNIQNNLIRKLPAQVATALLGIDGTDTAIAVGTVGGPSNAFNQNSWGGIDQSGTWTSNVLGTPPVPRVSINSPGAVDPGFLGEMITQTQFAQLQNPYVRDWRVVPTSALVNAGSGPVTTATTASIGALSGLTYVEQIANGVRAFDWDGDGVGNPRRKGLSVDIGFDENDVLATAGCYGNDSKSHGQKFHPTIKDGNINRTYITKSPVLLEQYFTTRFVQSGLGWTFSPGSHEGVPAGALGTLYLTAGFTIQSLGTTASTTWTNAVDGTQHTFAQLVLPSDDFGPTHHPYHLNTQVLRGTVNAKLSNLQFEIY